MNPHHPSSPSPSLVFLISLGLWLAPACTQEEQQAAPAAPVAGPEIVYTDAFPGQAPFSQPLFVAFAATDPAGAYVVEQTGQVVRVPRAPDGTDRRVLLDLTGRVFHGDNWEEGLLGFQFDPAYQDNGFVYACWSEKIDTREEPMARGKRKSNRQSVIARYTTREVDGGRVADVDSELRLLEVFQPFGNHNGGTIVFGPDGMLYIALGDGGAANDPFGNSESLAMLLGKVLRIDVRGATAEQPYTIPADNPFVGQDGARGEIWAYGLRNVWRMAFDRETGELWAGDVGQNRIEEVDVLVAGGFYGWNTYEADEKFDLRRSNAPTPADAIAPIASYTHREGTSITGGNVYRGAAIEALQGWFVYGDFMTRRMWACKRGADGAPAQVVTLANAPFQPSSFAEEPDGELLMTCFTQNQQGRVYRLSVK